MSPLRHLAAAITLAVKGLAFPKREQPWTCATCGASNEAARARCMNGCGTTGPLAPRFGGA